MSHTPDLKPKARARIHEVLLKWFAEAPRGRLLDAPAGYGHLSLHLKDMGYDVVCGEIQPEIFKAAGMTCVYADLNRRIDAPDATFDYVCCVEGLEHMTDPYRAVEELARVLKPGGCGVFTLPNYSHIEARARFFFRGYLAKPKTIDDFARAQGRLFDLHNSPLTITLLDLMFAINGLTIERILRDKVKTRQYVLWPLVLMLKSVALFSSPESRRKHRSDLTLRDEVLWGGNTLIFITRKRPSS
jgi:SAM-dependent methyltransferase